MKILGLAMQYIHGGTSGPPPLDPNAQAIIDAITNAGGTIPTGGNAAINDFVIGLKADSLWNKMVWMYGFVGGTDASHAINWRYPGTGNIVWNGSITSTVDGSHGDGASSYGELSDISSLDPSDLHLSLYSKSADGAAGLNMGASDGSSFVWLALNHNSALDIISGPFSSRFTAGNSQAGFVLQDVVGSANSLFYNSTPYGGTNNAGALPSLPIWCFGRNDSMSLSDANNKNICFISIGGSVSSSQSNLYTKVQALQTALGRQV